MRNLRINVSKKIMIMVVIPIVCICIIAGIVTSIIVRTVITNEIELQLKASAYSVSQVLNAVKSIDNSADILMSEVNIFKTN